jgi:hypothetical protein
VLLAVETFFLQNHGWDAAFKQRQPRVMRSSDNSKDAHGVELRWWLLRRVDAPSPTARWLPKFRLVTNTPSGRVDFFEIFKR